MGASGRFDHLRHAALDMLDAGNSSASVAQMLAVPVSVIQDWRNQPLPPRPEPEAMLAALGAQGHAPSFGTMLVVNRLAPEELWRRTLRNVLKSALAIGLFAFAYRSWKDQVAFGDFYVDVLSLGACSLLWLDRYQPLLRLDGRAIVVPRLLGKAVMPYADLADWWLVMHVLHEDTDHEVEGRLLTLHSRRPGVRPVSVFISDAVTIPPGVLERLELVKKTNQGAQPLTPIRHLPKA
jgi:hypothetical protein